MQVNLYTFKHIAVMIPDIYNIVIFKRKNNFYYSTNVLRLLKCHIRHLNSKISKNKDFVIKEAC